MVSTPQKIIIGIIGFFLLTSHGFAQDKNPDGVIGRPSITLMGGFRIGNGESTIWSNSHTAKYTNNRNLYGLQAEIIYPTTKSISLILNFDGSWQKNKLPETPEFDREEHKESFYGLSFGIRLFTQ